MFRISNVWRAIVLASMASTWIAPSRLTAQVEFTECADLVLRPRGPGFWDARKTCLPAVTQFDGVYYMWYTGDPDFLDNLLLGLAVSDGDPCVFRPPDAGVLGHVRLVQAPHAFPIVDGGELEGFRIWYTSWVIEEDRAYIGYAEWKDGVITKEAPEPVLVADATWEGSYLGGPTVLDSAGSPRMLTGEDRVLKMWYRASSAPLPTHIGYAESSDGLHWDKYPRNPVLEAGGMDESVRVHAPDVLFDEASGTYEMWYMSWNGSRHQIAFARSVDGLAWAKHGLVTWHGATTSVFGPAVIREGDTYHLWFSGSPTGIWEGIGYAESSWTVPRASFRFEPHGEDDPLTFTFDPSRSTTPADVIIAHQWDFDDESPIEEGSPVVHTFPSTGEYDVTLTVHDDLGNPGSVAGRVRVEVPTEHDGEWKGVEIGDTAFPGASRLREGCTELFAPIGGQNAASDQIHFRCREVPADSNLVLTARIDERSLRPNSDIVLMLRDGTDASARCFGFGLRCFGALDRYRFTVRSTHGLASVSRAVADPEPSDPVWLQLVRRDGTLEARVSDDGTTWETVPPPEAVEEALEDLAFSDDLYAGVSISDGTTTSYAGLSRATVCDLELAISPPAPRFSRGNANGDGTLDITDAIFTLDWLFVGGSPPGCLAAANANGDSAVDIADPVYWLSHLFLGGPPPPEPFPGCGPGSLAIDEELGCEAPSPTCRR